MKTDSPARALSQQEKEAEKDLFNQVYRPTLERQFESLQKLITTWLRPLNFNDPLYSIYGFV